tara:strand:- start:23119 stop:26325 length:3207 start_codon:yes stop_codon:yes gene_type:complete
LIHIIKSKKSKKFYFNKLFRGVYINTDKFLKDILYYRCIGPFRGGRVVAVVGDPKDANIFYFGACAGGVWKTYDGGLFWENISDNYFNSASIGAIAVSDSNPNIIYVGTGEACIRGNVTTGDGVYKSTDAGLTWENIGLEKTRHISRIRIHPTNPDLVYVAAFGDAFGPNEERGIFRSSDGGQNWEKILYNSPDSGASDLSIDSNDPNILLACLWEGRRSFWEMKSGGNYSGLYRSIDGGDSWIEISQKSDLPKGVKGRMGVSISPAKPGRVWTLIESEFGGLFRSEDYGETWEKINQDKDIRDRPWYYTHVFADPSDEETVWVLANKAWKSIDGGKTFTEVVTPHVDNHDIWIDSNNSQRIIEGNDGGACISYNGGESWSSLYNQPTSQFYFLDTDNQFPYRVYGTQQDNSAVSVPSMSAKGSIRWDDCFTVGLSESGKIAVNPNNPNIVYSSYPGGALQRYDRETDQVRLISVWPEYEQNTPPEKFKYRFAWEFPIIISVHDSKTLYVSSNFVFKSTNEGESWEIISPDLTRNDTSKQQLSGPITSEGVWAEVYGTVYALAESKFDSKILWSGTDDGLIHITYDGGKTWKDITPNDLPEYSMISCIETSNYKPGIAYVVASRYKLADNVSIVYKTEDFGKNWHKLTNGIPSDEVTRVLREDSEDSEILFLGTEKGIYISFDQGSSFETLQLNLPVVPVYDIKIKNDELIVATHGRSFWILEGINLLRQLRVGINKDKPFLFKSSDKIRTVQQLGGGLSDINTESFGKRYSSKIFGEPATYIDKKLNSGEIIQVYLDAGQNPQEGLSIIYYVPENFESELSISIIDSSNHVIRIFNTENTKTFSLKPGLNRIVWDLKNEEIPELPDIPGGQSPFIAKETSILLIPGTYNIRLNVGDEYFYEQSFNFIQDPRSKVSLDDLVLQYDLQKQIQEKYLEIFHKVKWFRKIRDELRQVDVKQISQYKENNFQESLDLILLKLSEIENEIVPFKSYYQTPPVGIPVGIYGKYKELKGGVSGGDYRPTQQSYELFEDLNLRLEEKFLEIDNIIKNDIFGIFKILKYIDISDTTI